MGPPGRQEMIIMELSRVVMCRIAVHWCISASVAKSRQTGEVGIEIFQIPTIRAPIPHQKGAEFDPD